MACEFLQGLRIKSCGAVREQMVLSLDELCNLCESGRYHTCDYYQERMKEGIKIPIMESSRYSIQRRV